MSIAPSALMRWASLVFRSAVAHEDRPSYDSVDHVRGRVRFGDRRQLVLEQRADRSHELTAPRLGTTNEVDHVLAVEQPQHQLDDELRLTGASREPSTRLILL